MWKKGGLVNRPEEVRLAFVLSVPMKAVTKMNLDFFFLRETYVRELYLYRYTVYLYTHVFFSLVSHWV